MGTRNRATAQFLEQYSGVGEGTSLSAVFLGNGDAQPSGGHQSLPRLRRYGLLLRSHLQQSFFRIFHLDKTAHRGLQHFLFFGEGQVHDLMLPFFELSAVSDQDLDRPCLLKAEG